MKLASIVTSKSVLDETAHLYLAESQRPVSSEPGAMTAVAVLHAARRRSSP